MLSSKLRSGALAVLVALVAVTPAVARPRGNPPPDVASECDAVLAPYFAADAPGVAAIVVKDGRVVYRKAFGLANLELKTPMRPEMVFEIGSVTKQFTSASVMMLVDRGKVALDADVRTYLPDFPDKGAKITVENLLTHTSGIPSYTENPKWRTMLREDMTPQQIVDITKDEPLAFPPGTKWEYDNTGYTLLGMIVEKASGMSYADFVRKNIFEPLGMTHSYYGDNAALIPNRAAGYAKDESGWVNAPYLSMTQPYAAGSLMSTVDDLALWDAAVTAGKLLSKASWDRVFTPYKLASGEDTHYGYGWEIGSYEGRAMVRHNGGIPGYVSEVARMPKEGVYVAMLTNSTSPPVDTGFLATRLAAAAAGIPYHEPTAVKLDPAAFDAYAGVYRIDAETTRVVTREGDRYFVKRDGRPKAEIFAERDGRFFLKDSFQRFEFAKDASGRVTEVVSIQPNGAREVAKRTDKPIPAAPVAVTVPADVLARYVGVYRLAPDFDLAVTVEGGRLITQATGQEKIEITPSSPTEFFVERIDARLTFVAGADGRVEKLVLVQGGRTMDAPKVK